MRVCRSPAVELASRGAASLRSFSDPYPSPLQVGVTDTQPGRKDQQAPVPQASVGQQRDIDTAHVWEELFQARWEPGQRCGEDGAAGREANHPGPLYFLMLVG
mmetsp:Transcript_36402/g.96790  ORF Transcript_36402/g.96790 Transcript_36402/m.96790 type:complete len:103 (-) Transcript_36402:577-885(-)